MIIYMLGNVGTHKSTHARYIADKYGFLILDDDEIYHNISNKSWKYYYDQKIQDMVVDMIQTAMMRSGAELDLIVASTAIDPFQMQEASKPAPFKVIVTGNGTREFSEENRTKNHRGYPIKKWMDIYDREKLKIDKYLNNDCELLNKLFSSSLVLSNTLDEEKSKAEIDAFMCQPRWLKKT